MEVGTPTGVDRSICCAQSADDENDPLIEACTKDNPTSEIEYAFASDSCTSITTTTTIFRNEEG